MKIKKKNLIVKYIKFIVQMITDNKEEKRFKLHLELWPNWMKLNPFRNCCLNRTTFYWFINCSTHIYSFYQIKKKTATSAHPKCNNRL